MGTRDAQADVNSAVAVAVAAVSLVYIQLLSSQWTEATSEPTQPPQKAAVAAAEGFTFELEMEAPGGQRQQRQPDGFDVLLEALNRLIIPLALFLSATPCCCCCACCCCCNYCGYCYCCCSCCCCCCCSCCCCCCISYCCGLGFDAAAVAAAAAVVGAAEYAVITSRFC